MKRSSKLKELRGKLKSKKKELNDFEQRKIDKDGKLDFEVALELQRINTDIHYISKQIGFLKKGKGHLGTSFYDTNLNDYT